MSRLLTLCAAAPEDERLEEFLRYLVGLVAAGRDVTLLVVERGAALQDEDAALGAEAETYLEALGDAGIRPRVAVAAEIAGALARHDGVLCLGPHDRAGEPDVLRIDADRLARAAEEPEALLEEMLAAGQVVRAV